MSREEYERNTGGFFPYLVGKVPIRLYDGQIKVVDRVELELLTPEKVIEILSDYREVEEFFRTHGLL